MGVCFCLFVLCFIYFCLFWGLCCFLLGGCVVRWFRFLFVILVVGRCSLFCCWCLCVFVFELLYYYLLCVCVFFVVRVVVCGVMYFVGL